MGDRFLSDSEVQARVLLSNSQRWRLEQVGKFPKRIKPGNNSQQGRAAWSEREIDEWIESRKAARTKVRE
jgi:prophage regulatory protein